MKRCTATRPNGHGRRHLQALLAAILGACLAIFALTTAAQAASRIALVIGNARYQHAPWLANPANDARLMADTLSRLGFQVLYRTDVTQAGLRRALSEFTADVAAAGPDSLALFYYAGHGAQLGGVNYLIPVDADITNEREVVLGGISAGDLLRTLELASAGANIIILDACRDNPFKQAARGISRGLARMDAPVGSIIGYATAPGQTATDGDGANSPYTQALAAALVMPDLAIEQVFKQVRRQVYEWTGGNQTPWEESSLIQEVVLGDGATLQAAGASSQPAASEVNSDVGSSDVPEIEMSRGDPEPVAKAEAVEPASDSPPTDGVKAVAREWPDSVVRIRDFIRRYHETWSGSGQHAATEIGAFYGDTVRYYGAVLSRSEVLRDKSRFAARWPARDYRFDADTLQVSCSSKACSAAYQVRFLAQDREDDRSSSGTAEARVVLAISGEDLAIIAEDSAVLQRD